jgi:hypothetical protein
MADQYDIRDVSFLLTYDNRDCVVSRSNSILYNDNADVLRFLCLNFFIEKINQIIPKIR